MTISNYNPTFRNVLLEVVELTQTKGGIYIPSSVVSKEKEYRAHKIGKDCLVIKPGDTVKILSQMHLQEIELDGRTYYQIAEQQIIGYERKEDDSIRATPKRKSKTTTSSGL